MTRSNPDRSVREARDAYLAENGFNIAAYTEKTFALPVFGRAVHLPNPPSRQRALARHVLHHALTGYGTDYIGEAEIGLWELRAGCNTAFLWFINSMAVFLGLFLSPARLVRAWRTAAGARSLYIDERDLETLLEMKLGELRVQHGIPREGIAPRRSVGRAGFTKKRAQNT